MAESAVDAEISAGEAGTDSGGEFLYSDFIVQRWGAGCRPGSAGAVVTRVVTVSEHSDVLLLPRCGPTSWVFLTGVHSLGVL